MAKAPAKKNQFDERRETLVMERKTTWAAELSVDESERERIADMLHQKPQDAGQLEYIRSPTGFIRHITVTPEDIDRLKSSS